MHSQINQTSQKIVEKTCLKTYCFLTSIFCDFGFHFGSQAGSNFRSFFDFLARYVQHGPLGASRAPQDCPRALQERPRPSHKGAKSAPKALQKCPGAPPKRKKRFKKPKKPIRTHKNSPKHAKHIHTRENISKKYQNLRKHLTTYKNA